MEHSIRTRREILRLAAGGLAGLALAPLRGGGAPLAVVPPLGALASATAPAALAPLGRQEWVLLAGTPWETWFVTIRAEASGPTVMVLGGVHGDEPGAWLAADDIASWEPKTGTLIVVPRVNGLAVNAGVRTLPELGDLNRLYPGSPTAKLPMARMADALVGLARFYNVQTVYDMHESWGFYAGRPLNGNAFLGQTVSLGAGPDAQAARDLVVRVNRAIPAGRERMVARSEIPAPTVKTTNSLGIGRFVEGLTTLLVEMGQEGQPESRRTALHLMVARAFLESRGML